jgi:hypothetical protein
MAKQIDPKPTTYFGTTYRSRLEARWAVFLDNSPNILNWQYEPRTISHPRTNWSYTPDFRVVYFRDQAVTPFTARNPYSRTPLIWTDKQGEIYVEVKPERASNEYMELLKDYSKQIPIFLVCGDFFTMSFETCAIVKGKLSEFKLEHLCGSMQNAQKAATVASQYRFDLH